MSLNEENNKQQAASEEQKTGDPEYILKGVQAFSIGVALFAASVAVAHTAIAQVQGDLPLAIKITQTIIFVMLTVAISTFGSIAVILGLSMTGFIQMRGPIRVFEWGTTTTWIVLAFVVSSVV
ncbi:hypothetical protein FLO80_00840 [Aquicoccus porphyridii]|uniref:Uncharacterized protein n=1 Tax=Aquicoccus porphyridii TaxID=1852029 RepID=A0A5A9ZTU8_9RHOB|nr:hypothetical protein [Aquicoccus porphyridii]KAA0920754.1 hypothetical protein FLO80_00840 [Aquicoccus porphyridii]RAI56697.1 hypothetical protein DOO74_02235 [Rhodobacteraceae bacterium AsT-22]